MQGRRRKREKREKRGEAREKKEVRQEQEERRIGHTANRLLEMGIEPKRAAPSEPISVKGTQVPVSCFVLYHSTYHTSFVFCR